MSMFVRGRVARHSHNLRMAAFDRDMRHAEPLGQVTTDHEGRFEIEYSANQFRRAEKGRADLFVRVLDEKGRQLYESETRFNAADVEVFEIELPVDAFCDPDEWTSMCADIAAPSEGVAVAELTDEDLEFLAKETAIPQARLRLLRLDAAWSCTHGMPHGFFYGLLRKGLPSVLPRLLAAKPDRWRNAILAAIDEDIVPESLRACLDDALTTLEDLADALALSGNESEFGMPAVATVATTVLSDEQRKQFARALRHRGQVDEELWTELAALPAFGTEAVSHARFVLTVEPLVLGHLPTLRAVDEYRRERGWTEAIDLARLDRDDWRSITKASSADGLPGAVQDAEELATTLAHNVEVAYPTMTIARGFERSNDPGRGDVARFLIENPGFDLLRSRVDKALEDGATVGNLAEPNALAPRLKAVARTARVAASADRTKVHPDGLAAGVTTLLDNGFDSARKIVGRGKPAFVKTMTPTMGEGPAVAAFDVALSRADSAEMLNNHLRDYLRDPVFVIPRLPWGDPPEDWGFLLDGSSSCECKHCRSVLSPSAYLADLLHSLESSPGEPYDELTRDNRRPDIPKTRLSCANANTTLPYIDLVNEILADALVDDVVSARSTSGEAPERRAMPDPDHIRADADAELAARRPPWELPFEAGHEEALAWAEHLELSLDEVHALAVPAAPDRTRLRLGMGPALRQLLLSSAPLAVPANVAAFLATSGLSHAELVALTESWFFSADGAGDLSIADGGDPCDLSRHTLVGFAEVAIELERFVRLSRHLGLAIDEASELDAALEALGATSLTADVLESFVAIRSAARSIRRSVRELVSAEIPLTDLVGLSDLEIDLLKELTGTVDAIEVQNRVTLIEAHRSIRASGFSIRELANVLVGWDQSPAAFFPSTEQAAAFLVVLGREYQSEVEARLLTAESDAQALAAAAAAPDRDAFLRSYYGEKLIVDRLAESLDLASDRVDRLVRPTAAGPAALTAADRAGAAVSDFVAFASLEAGGDPVIAEQLHEAAASTLERLGRAARLVRGLGLSAEDIEDLVLLGTGSGFLSLDLDPSAMLEPTPGDRFAAFVELASAARVSRALPNDSRVFALMARADDWYAGDDLTVIASFRELEEATGWPSDTVVEALTGLGLATVEALRRFDTYQRLGAIVSLAHRFRVGASVVIGWGNPSSPASLAASLRETAEQRTHDHAIWFSVVTPVNDRLREARRDALLAALMDKRGFSSPGKIYAHYLIDSEMSACQLTSRIKQAVASVQLYIQRLLMGIDEVRLDDTARQHWKNWEWMKNYRVWEANRKVFLYPENWIESELRDDKSPPFKGLESRLLQDEATSQGAETAYFAYVDELDEVSRLDIRGFHFEREDGRAAEGMRGGVGPGTLHVFGRTRSSPHVYYYRWRDPSRVWSPWERIDLPIEGDHLVPFASEGRLILAWVSFRESQDEEVTLWEPEVSWSERRNSIWTPTQNAGSLPGWIINRAHLPPSSHFFRVVETRGELYLAAYQLTWIDHEGNSRAVRVDRAASVRFERCDRRMVLSEAAFLGGAYLPPWSNPEGNLAVENAGADGPLSALVSNSDPIAGDDGYALPILANTPGQFRVTPSFQQASFALGAHFVVEIQGRVYLATPALQYTEWMDSGHTLEFPAYTFEHLYHPYMCNVGQALYEGGPPKLLAPPWSEAGHSLDRQLLSELPGEELFPEFAPTGLVLEPHPYEEFDFNAEGAYSGYNWELFFHIPLLIAESLSKNHRFDEARRWFHFIFDPTDVSRHNGIAKYWRPKPLYMRARQPIESIGELLEALAAGDVGAEDQIEAWKEDPFNPHRIARHRTLAYMRAVVMKYLDNLIAWGDDLFSRDTIESLNEASQLYVLAAEILGEAGESIEAPERESRSYEELGELDAFANALEDSLPVGASPGGSPGGVPRTRLYFCVPPNEKLASYRATVADRLTKIRTCLDIEGRFRQLPLFEPPIDPGLLVRARAAGLDVRDALMLADGTSLPRHRYIVLANKALEICGDVRAFGSALAAALERKDAEEITSLRSRHEVTLLARVSDIQRKQVEEARESLGAANESLRAAEARRLQYEEWAEEYRNPGEQAQLDHLHVAHGFEVASQVFEVGAAVAHLLPDLKTGIDVGTLWGGSFLGNASRAAAGILKGLAGQFTFEASMSSTEGAHSRRRDEWLHQAGLAEIEEKQIARQILAAEIRLAIAEATERNHQTQLAQAREVEDFLRRKFTNSELYGWMVSQLSKLYRDSYRMARDLAMRAERAARHELGLGSDELRIVGLDHWDSLRRGLLAGDQLHHDLRRLDAAYLDKNRRELEMTKHISLAQLNPEQLIALREKNTCSFKVPEMLFDLEFPGHFRRRIKSASVTIPAVTGPTTNIGAVLTLDRSYIRVSTDVSGGYARTPANAERFIDASVAQRSIATSSAQRDSGVFELNFRDERFLPFEGAGVDSEWTLELPAAIRPFDYDTISDVVLHLSYSASEGPPAFRNAVEATIHDALGQWLALAGGAGDGLMRVFSMRRELSTELHQFLHPARGVSRHETSFELGPKHLPHLLRGFLDPAAGQPRLEITGATVIVKFSTGLEPALPVEFGPDASVTSADLGVVSGAWGGLSHASFPQTGAYSESVPQRWTLRVDAGGMPADLTEEQDGVRFLRSELVEDIYIALRLELRLV